MIMAFPSEKAAQDSLIISSDLIHTNENSSTTARVRYTEEDLLSLKPVNSGSPAQNTRPSISDAKLPSVTFKDEMTKVINPPSSQPTEGAESRGNVADYDSEESVPDKKKMKKKKKSSGKNKKETPTGFEEFFADAPITAEEHAEEISDIYHPSRSFVERIQQCIQRFRGRRKLNSERANILSKYLVLGGVDAGVKAFNGGLDKDTLENSTAAEIADIRAIDHIRSNGPVKYYNAGNPENWVVDFESVAKGFLSEKAPAIFGIQVHNIMAYCGVVSNFLGYVLRHDVCNEHNMNILAALRICAQAEKELQLIGEVSKLLPGDFNVAASTLYGGSYHKLPSQEERWDDTSSHLTSDDPEYEIKKTVGMTLAEADRIFKTGIAFSGTYEHFREIMARQCYVVKEEIRSMEVCEIVQPDKKARQKLLGAKDEFGHSGHALGILKVKHWDSPDALEEDRSEAGREDNNDSNMPANQSIDSFWLEENILEKCFLGMKLTATVRELSIGLKYLNEILRVECSFYTYLETERLDRWKEPVLNERPGPTVDDPDRDLADDADCDCD